MVFFGKARWEDHAAEHGAHGDFKPHESPWIMLTPLVVLAGLAAVGGIIQLPDVTWLPDSFTHHLEHWLEPVVEFGEANIDGTWAVRQQDDPDAHRHAPPPSPGSSSPGWSTSGTASRPSSRPCSPTPGTTTGPSPTSWAARGGRRSRAPPGSTPTSSTAPSTAPARVVRDVAGELRKGQSGYVRGYAGIIGIGVVAAPRLVRRRQGDPLVDGRRASPSSRRSSWRPVAGAFAVALVGRPPARARQAGRAAGQRRSRPPSACGCSSSSTPRDPGFQFVSQARVDRGRGASRGTSASTASRCSSSC